MFSIIIGSISSTPPASHNDAVKGYESMKLESTTAHEMRRRTEAQRTQIRFDETNKSFTERMKTYGRPTNE